jgi:hypothetical protein
LKIIFSCGCLEPGRDGVGDYIRHLASELALQGHEAAAVAFKDPYIMEVCYSLEKEKIATIPILRIPEIFAKAKRYYLLNEWLVKEQADWISLQFVPFSFHTKGLPFDLAKTIKPLTKNAHFHIMFHELWAAM